MDVSDTKPASVEELLVALALRVSSRSAVVVVLTAVLVVGILDFKLPLLRRFDSGSGSPLGWFARFLPLPLIRSGAVASADSWPPFFWAAGFLRAGCRRLVALRWPEAAASASGGAGASELRALMAVNPDMMMKSPRSIRCGSACRTDVAVDNALVWIFASRSVAESSSLVKW